MGWEMIANGKVLQSGLIEPHNFTSEQVILQVKDIQSSEFPQRRRDIVVEVNGGRKHEKKKMGRRRM
ncbi:hypothetical protein RIF29_26048 [Crotalaria pallida]|uniref:Uncharacterized protein n=1 Tax=Crotalaria pallida TaxID=3830 RepID=A0AAN9EMW9_CROPI